MQDVISIENLWSELWQIAENLRELKIDFLDF